MSSSTYWGGSFEINTDAETEESRNIDYDEEPICHHHLDETQQRWLLVRQSGKEKNKYIDFGCIICSHKAIKWILSFILVAFLVIALPTIIARAIPKHHSHPLPPDNYEIALHKALLFFNAQKSGKLPKNNGIPWRGDSGLLDGVDSGIEGGLVGGYYDAGDNIKFNFPMSFAMTMLSWSVIEYSHKYRAIGEYDHARELIKWGADYLLRTFNSSKDGISHIFSQVGVAKSGANVPDDHYCWQRPEDMDYKRPVQRTTSGTDLAGEMASALASASIVFRDHAHYSKKLISSAKALFTFANDMGRRGSYSSANPDIAMFYNSSGYLDEHIWAAGWLYYATGSSSYLDIATDQEIAEKVNAFAKVRDLSVLSWDNKLPAIYLLLTRLRIFLNPGYPYEEMLRIYHNLTGLNMCAFIQQFHMFNWTQGGLIQLNRGKTSPLQMIANAAFQASLFADYLSATGVPGWFCGAYYIPSDILRNFAISQIDYILGQNPQNLSYVVGYGRSYPTHVHHRGASIPHDGKKYSCTTGWRWRNSKQPNPNVLVGAMVGGPDHFDNFKDIRENYSYTEPTLAGNAGLVAALISLTRSGTEAKIDSNTIFSAIPPLYRDPPPLPSH